MSADTQPSVAHAGFTLVRDYPASIERVWAAFAEEDQRRVWFGLDAAWTPGEWEFDFTVGGRDVAVGDFHGGPESRYVAYYTDILEHERIVITYNMWLDGAHISTSVASFEFEALADGGTRFTHTEHGVHLDGFDTGAQREAGTVSLLDKLGLHLAG
jgi:uncharacterized protein YndB with AHSA1/START domain